MTSLEIKEVNIFLSPHEPILKDEGIFGLGRSSFDPATNTIKVGRYSSNPIEALVKNDLLALSISTAFSHEIGHYCLTSGSRLGIVIKNLNVVLDGICLSIIKRMVKRHQKIWIPFSRYLEFPGREESIERLIRVMFRLDQLENKLVDDYKVTQELFAYCWTGLSSTFPKALFSTMIGEERIDALLKYMTSLGLVSNYEKMNEINEKIRQFFLERGIRTEQIGEKEIAELFENLGEIFGSEREMVEGVLNLAELIRRMYISEKDFDMNLLMRKVLEEYRGEADKDYEKSYYQHIEALKIFRSYSKDPLGDMVKIVISLLGASCLFAPVVDPNFIKEDKPIETKSMDELTRSLMEEISSRWVDLSDPNSMISFMTAIQEKTGSIKIRDMDTVHLSSILGSRQWFSKLIANSGLSRKERKFVKRLMNSYRVIDLPDKALVESERLISLLPTSLKLMLRMIFRFKNKLKKLRLVKRVAVPIFETLEKLDIRNAKTLLNLVDIYQDILFSPPVTMLIEINRRKEGEVIKPSFAVYVDQKVLTLYSNKDFSTEFGKLAIYRHIIGNLKEVCLKGSGPQTLCPIAYLKGNESLCDKGTGECWLYKLMRLSTKSGELIICCKDGKASFVRTYERTCDPGVVLTFKIDDRDAQRKREKVSWERDMLDKIWKLRSDLFIRPYKKEGKQSKEYDGEVRDLYEHSSRRMQRIVSKIMPLVFGALWYVIFALLIPFLLDYKIHKAVSKYKLKRVIKAGRETEKHITEILSSVHVEVSTY
jgi:hypothetical protein